MAEEARKLDKEQFFERSSLALMACLYNLEDVDATEKEVEFYKANGGKAATAEKNKMPGVRAAEKELRDDEMRRLKQADRAQKPSAY